MSLSLSLRRDVKKRTHLSELGIEVGKPPHVKREVTSGKG